jgi:hypothetical protein
MLMIAPALPHLTARPVRTTLLILSETSMNDRDAAFVRNVAKGERDMVAGVFLARISTAPGPFSLRQFLRPPARTSGNVGVSLSGGGSRALTAGMGQLRALRRLTVNGHSLLAQVKALSVVSGGAWLGVPYVYLPPAAPSDTAYLGPWVEDQAVLTPEMLEVLPAGNAGVPISSPMFSPPLLAVQAVLLHSALQVPPDMLWQTIVGLNILAEYGLYAPTLHLAPNDTFSFDAATVADRVTGPNPRLADETIYSYADVAGSGREQRPFLICNSAMFLNEALSSLQLLAPVQTTPFITGIFGMPQGEDTNGRKVGGGGVTSFGSNSVCEAVSGSTATIVQTRQWSLTDAVGTSSAFYAEVLQNMFHRWREDPVEPAALMARESHTIQHWIKRKLSIEQRDAATERLRLYGHSSAAARSMLQSALSDLQELIPRYQYWPVLDPHAGKLTEPNRFADGGNLENTGIAALLAYADIDGIIAFVNSSVPLEPGAYGVSDGHGGFLPATAIVIDDSIPPLFGYQPYGTGKPGNEGYVPYQKDGSGLYPMFANNQVFDQAAFPALLQGLWEASGRESRAFPAVFSQRLAVMQNGWFGIMSAREVTVVWNYLGFVGEWVKLFDRNKPVQAIIEAERATNGFPNYSTLKTNLSATQINLLANLTAWSLNQAEGTRVFSRLFKSQG